MSKRPKVNKAAVYSDAELLGGVPVFRGTRVFFQTLIDYLETGHPLSGFLSDFPKVTRKQGLAALDQAKEALLASTRVLDDGCGIAQAPVQTGPSRSRLGMGACIYSR